MLRHTEQRVQYLQDQINRHMLKSMSIILFISVIIPMIPGGAYAQSNYISRPQLAFNVSFEYDKDISFTPSRKRVNTAHKFREGVEISTWGWVYHPALVVYSIEYTPEWEQSGGSNFSGTNSVFHGFSTDMTFLKFKPYNFFIYAKRTSARIQNSFAETTRVNSDQYGARFTSRYGRVLQTFLNYDHLETTKTGLFESDTNRDSFLLSMSYNRQQSSISLNASYEEGSQNLNDLDSVVDNENKQFDLSHKIDFFNDNKLKLGSSFSYEELFSTFLDEENYVVIERLIWHHTTDLQTRYEFRYDKSDRFNKRQQLPVQTEREAYNFILNHSLYENLRTNIDVDFNDVTYGDNREERYGIDISWNYRRRIPWGNLGIGINQTYGNVNVLESEDFTQIIDEIHTIDLNVSFLANADIDAQSIIITDSSGNLLFKDFHYELVETGNFTGIRCRPELPDCSEGVDVLVDYSYRSRFPFDYSSRGQFYGITLNLWSVLDLNYSFSKYKQEFLGGIRPDELAKSTIHTAGAGLTWRKSITTVEFENVDSTIGLSFRRIMFMETVSFMMDEEWYVNIMASHNISEYEINNYATHVSNINANAQKPVFDRGTFRLIVFTRRVKSDAEDQTDTGFSTSLKWIYNIYDIDMMYTFNNEKNSVNNSKFENHQILLNVRRNLF